MKGNNGQLVDEERLRDMIFRKCFYRFRYEETLRKISLEFKTEHVMRDLMIYANTNGIDPEYMQRIIQQTITHPLHDFNLNSVQALPLSRMQPYDVVTVYHNDGQYIKMVCLINTSFRNKFAFIVQEDSTGSLSFGDGLKLLHYELSVNSSLDAAVIRENSFFPSNRHILHVERIESLNIYHPINLPSKLTENDIVYSSNNEIYAWSVKGTSSFFFTQDSLTNDPRAMFVLNLVDKTFYINPKCNKSLYTDGRNNYMQTLSLICDYSKATDESQRFSTVVPGTIKLFNVNKHEYALKVVHKAHVLV